MTARCGRARWIFVSFSYYSSRCITVDKELMAAENAEGNAVSASVKNPYLKASDGAGPSTRWVYG